MSNRLKDWPHSIEMHHDPTRRRAIGSILKLGLLAYPFGNPLLGAVAFGAGIEIQPLLAQVGRLVEAMAYLGEPFGDAERERLGIVANMSDEARAIDEIQQLLDPRCLLAIRINPESRISVDRGAAPPRLVEQGWRAFLIKVRNEAGATGVLNVESPQGRPVYRPGTGLSMAPQSVRPGDVADRWLELDTFGQKPMQPQLSGLDLEYRIVLLYSRDRGRREAQIGAQLDPGTEDIGFRNRAAVLFDVAPSRDVMFRVRDENGRPTTASFIIKDAIGRSYPARSKRLAPDFFFQDQVYRADGETVRLPAGEFTFICGRGPEYVPETRTVHIDRSSATASFDFRLRRWIDPPALGWYSGDHHIHAAGCAHYESPTEGVRPEDMMRHVLGEALSVGSVLNWGPSYYHQRQYFEAKDNKVSTASTLLRYDLEVSGFPSSFCGHLVLLRLRDHDYPDTRQIEDWPTWDLPILKWAKAQGAITGFAHSGLGLQVKSRDLPNYEMPGFNGIGANEYIMDVTHDVVDFISTADTPFTYELNIWYHTLNCGFRTRVSGETDFPCMTDDRVGAGRSYVHLPQALTYDGWCEGVRNGRSYVSDGFGHLMNFTANGREAGTNGGELHLDRPGAVRTAVRAACLLAEKPRQAGRPNPDQQPFWTPEHARVDGSREVTVEAILNGRPVASHPLTADGTLRDIAFDIPIERSSWIALRILGSAHTNPIFVHVGGRPIRASKRSAEWCLKAVDQCWSQKSPRIRQAERDAAQRAYDHARARYRQILSESDAD
ncbi:MAG: CehA/McbA family metallohydrolase [Vicinamibacterales bacterium]